MWRSGFNQFVPFIVTIAAIVFTDLLTGVALGMVVSVFFILRENLKIPYFFESKEHKSGDIIHINLAQEVSFLNKAAIKQTLAHIPANSYVIIDASDSFFIDHDVLELIKDFRDVKAGENGIRLELAGFKPAYEIDNTLRSQFVYSEAQGVETETAFGDVTVVQNNRPKKKHVELIEKLTNDNTNKALEA
jgi:MFS superfamily sulfate permease-like transporter